MQQPAIPTDTEIGLVSLTVSDLARSLEFYTESLGLKLFLRNGTTAQLGSGQNRFLELVELPGARQYVRTTGLYHMAILVPSRLELARVIQHLAETNTPLGGAADHLVSEALYLADPDENGIEIYRDRPRSEWTISNGQVEMATNPLDLDGIFDELKGNRVEWRGIAPETRMGHVHLKVARIEDAVNFYCNVLGFQLMARFGPAAAFVSAGGYHHHIGMNTWESRGAPPPPPDAVGLRYYTIRLPDAASVDQVTKRVKSAGIPIEQRGEDVLFRDRSQHAIVLTTKSK